MVTAFCNHVRDRIDHARKHLSQLEEDLITVADGAGEERFRAIKSAAQHCDVVVGDMKMAKATLES
jgi:hypothetical protein